MNLGMRSNGPKQEPCLVLVLRAENHNDRDTDMDKSANLYVKTPLGVSIFF